MLQAIREGAQGFFSWVILILISVPFALWGVNNYFGDGQERAVASVNDREFLQGDVSRALQPLKQRFNEALQAGMVSEEQLRKQALDNLILNALLTEETQHRNMTVSDATVRQGVMEIEVFQTDKRFDKKRYENLLAARGLSSRGFSEQLRQSMVVEQLKKGVTDSAFLSERAVRDFYRLRNQERAVSYFVVPHDLDANSIDISEAEIADYYRSNRHQFQTAEKLSVEYIELSLDSLASEISVDNEAVLAAYEEQKNSFIAAEKRSVSHILFAIDDNSDAGMVKAAEEKALKAAESLKAGESFVELAKRLSDDSSTAADGGKLGFIERGMMDKAFEEAAYGLSEGGVSEPVRSQYGFHLIRVDKVEGESIKPFESVRAELEATLRREAAEDLLYEKMEQMAEAAFEASDSLEPVAEQLGLKIQESQLFTRNQGEGLAADERFRALAFSDAVLNNENSELLELSAESAVVLHLKSREEARDRSLDEVRSEIAAQLLLEKKSKQVAKLANSLIEELKAGAKIADLAASNAVKLSSSGLVLRDDKTIPAELMDAVFKAAHPVKGVPVPVSVKTASAGQIVAVVEKVIDGDPGKVEAKELELAREYLATALGEAQWEATLLFLRSEADIRIAAKNEE
jgi:peptidyl-prolyl cis-trans isomerase D